MFSLQSLVVNEKFHFKLQTDCKQDFTPLICVTGTLLSKTSNNCNSQCVTVLPLVSPLINQLCVKLATHATPVNFSFSHRKSKVDHQVSNV